MEIGKRSTEITVMMLKKSLDDKKRQIDMIKNPRHYITEAPKAFLASEKLASSKKQGSLSPLKVRSGRSTDITVKLRKRNRSTSRNK